MRLLTDEGLRKVFQLIKSELDGIETGGGSGGSSVTISDTAPASTSGLWVDTSVGGVAKYWDGEAWTACKSVWG